MRILRGDCFCWHFSDVQTKADNLAEITQDVPKIEPPLPRFSIAHYSSPTNNTAGFIQSSRKRQFRRECCHPLLEYITKSMTMYVKMVNVHVHLELSSRALHALTLSESGIAALCALFVPKRAYFFLTRSQLVQLVVSGFLLSLSLFRYILH